MTQVRMMSAAEPYSLEFIQQRYEIVQSSISTLSLVMTRITEVTQISGSAEGGMPAIDFALLVAQLSTELSSGVITQKVIDLSVLILHRRIVERGAPVGLVSMATWGKGKGSL